MNCPRCGARLPATATECNGCGMPTVFMAADDDTVVEPEVLESLDEAERTRFAANPPAQPLGCTLGPGCGCAGLPVAVLAGVVVSSLMALLWVLSLGRVPFSVARMVRQVRRGFRNG